MTRGRTVFLLASGLLVVSILSGVVVGVQAVQTERPKDSFYKYLSVFSEVLRLVRQSYVDETELRTLIAGALEGSSDALDPFSMYIPEADVESYLVAREIGPRRSGLRVVKVRGAAYVMAVQEGSPAAEAGFLRGDIMTQVGGLSTRGMPLWEIERRLAGPVGSHLDFQILRAGETTEKTLELGIFDGPVAEVEDVDGSPLLRIPTFDGVELVAELVRGLEGDRLLVDLRGVAWGDTEAAYAVAKLFVQGELGVLLGRDGPVKTFSSTEEVWEGRLVVLIDRGSQGPAEILATILQQGAGASLVGQPSFGFAGQTRIVDLEAGGSLLITDGFYTGPDGEPLNEGLAPDLRVSDRGRSFTERDDDMEDLILRRALELLASDEETELDEAA